MTLSIYTYTNPYRIDKEGFFGIINRGFQVCASQTLVNGLTDQYESFYYGKLRTIKQFMDVLFGDWNQPTKAISQHAAIDNIIDSMDLEGYDQYGMNSELVHQSLKLNRSQIYESIRILFELNLDLHEINEESISIEQKILISIYRQLIDENNPNFMIKTSFTKQEVDNAIERTIMEVNPLFKENEHPGWRDEILKENIVVVHGIHQFTPLMLRTIEILSNFKTVIILFNYQPEYKNIYQTWIDIYSLFESKITFSKNHYASNNDNYYGGRLANRIAALTNGDTDNLSNMEETIELNEFNNVTEFASYVAELFEKAQKEKENDYKLHNRSNKTLYYMDEQFYGASSNVNEILKIYFPEQFGERQFLDYPIGHFFISLTNMWNPNEGNLKITDLSDVYECLMSGIIYENTAGELGSIFKRTKLFFDDAETIEQIIRKLKSLADTVSDLEISDQEDRLKRIYYLNVSHEEISNLIKGLRDLNEIASLFYRDFNYNRNSFRQFYEKVEYVLKKHVLEGKDLNPEFENIVNRVLKTLKETRNVNASASFDCLRETMQLYLKQEPDSEHGAAWIVRNFEQIDGDVLRKTRKNGNKKFHFACLSDQNMNITKMDLFPWPLDIEFFEVVQQPIDWKYRVYIRSKMEYKNYRRYALVYGLEFCHSDIKLSYIKNERDEVTEPYYLLQIMNAKIKENPAVINTRSQKYKEALSFSLNNCEEFDDTDFIRYQMCPKRFLLETLVEGTSVYKDRFLLLKYLEILLENDARRFFSGKTCTHSSLHHFLVQRLENDYSDIYRFANKSELFDVVGNAEIYLQKNMVKGNKGRVLALKDRTRMEQKECFLKLAFSSGKDEQYEKLFESMSVSNLQEALVNELSNRRIHNRHSRYCQYCSEKGVCLEDYKYPKN